MAFSVSDEHDSPRLTPAVQWLIAINVAVFFLQLTFFGQDVPGSLGFELRNLTEKPWTIVTYMFVHAGFWHLTMNMYTLYVFGPRVERAWTPGSFTRYYLWCGLGAWLLHMMLTRSGLLIGASGAVFGVMLAYALRWPDAEVLAFFVVPMKVKWLVFLLVVIDLAAGVASLGAAGGGVAHFAHLGGFAFGWMYLRTQSVGSLDRLRQRMSQLPDVSDETPRAIPRSHPRPRERGHEVDEIVARSNALAAKRPVASTSLTTKVGKQRTEALNDVLDKISLHGIESLTSDERRLLEEMSKRLRNT